jgi:hypothetical protein
MVFTSGIVPGATDEGMQGLANVTIPCPVITTHGNRSPRPSPPSYAGLQAPSATFSNIVRIDRLRTERTNLQQPFQTFLAFAVSACMFLLAIPSENSRDLPNLSPCRAAYFRTSFTLSSFDPPENEF